MAGEHDDRRFKSVLAQDAHGFAAIDVRQPHVHDDEVDLSGWGGLDTFVAVFGRDGFEFLVQRELFGQPIPQFRIIIDNENFACFCH